MKPLRQSGCLRRAPPRPARRAARRFGRVSGPSMSSHDSVGMRRNAWTSSCGMKAHEERRPERPAPRLGQGERARRCRRRRGSGRADCGPRSAGRRDARRPRRRGSRCAADAPATRPRPFRRRTTRRAAGATRSSRRLPRSPMRPPMSGGCGGGWAISIIAPRRRMRDAARRSSAGTSSAAFSAAFLISCAALSTASFCVLVVAPGRRSRRPTS